MRRKRNKKQDVIILNEGAYDFYEMYDPADKKSTTIDKIINYYLDKIRKYGRDSLTKKEWDVFNDAKRGNLSLDNPVYKKDKVTGDIEYDNLGNPIRIDKDIPTPGVPFVTSKGKGGEKKEIINGRCYWNVDENFKTFYVFGGESNETNPHGLIIWKTVSSGGKEFGAFIVPKGESNLIPNELWKILNNKFDKGIILDKKTFSNFLEFDNLYHTSKKQNYDKISSLYKELSKYPS